MHDVKLNWNEDSEESDTGVHEIMHEKGIPMLERARLIIFDGGGTIWYSMDVLWEHYKLGFSFYGLCRYSRFPYSLEVCNEINSLQSFNSRKNIARALLALYVSGREPEKILEGSTAEKRLEELVQECSATHPKFDMLSARLGGFLVRALYNYPDVRYPLCQQVKIALADLKREGYSCGMISNRYKPSVLRILRAHKIDSMFSWIEVPRTKKEAISKTEPIHRMMKRLGVKREECVFVGDSALDIVSAKDAGLLCVGLLSGMGNQRSFMRGSRRLRPDLIFDHVGQFVARLTSAGQ